MGVAEKPLTRHLGPLGDPEGMTRGEAVDKARAVREMVATPGWTILLELIESQLRHDQKALMSASSTTNDPAAYNRRIGEWAGMRDIPKLAEGMIRYGEQAQREIEEGEAAEAA